MSISVIPSNFLSIWWGSLTSTISYNTLNRAAAFCCLLLLYILLYLSLRFLFPHSPPSWFLSFFINSVFHYFPIIILSWHIFLYPIPWNFFSNFTSLQYIYRISSIFVYVWCLFLFIFFPCLLKPVVLSVINDLVFF